MVEASLRRARGAEAISPGDLAESVHGEEETICRGVPAANGHGAGARQKSGGDEPAWENENENESGMGNGSARENASRADGGCAVQETGNER